MAKKKKTFPNKGKDAKFQKGNGSNRQDRRDVPREEATTKTNNDASWYANTPQLLKDAASLSFNNPLGVGVDILNEYTEGLASNLSTEPIPGVCSINLVPTVGESVDGSSPVNVAARNIYSFVRHANSGSRNYDSPDLMMYLIAVSSAYSFYSWLCRLYGVMNVYSRKNRYLPKILVESMQVDYDDLIGNLSDFRTYVNTCALKLSTLAVPANMTYFRRQFWIYANVFKDSSNPKAQMYLFNPEYFLKWEGRALDTGSALSVVSMRNPEEGALGGVRHLLTFQELRSTFDSMLSPLLVDEDIGIMSGDIMKAYPNLLSIDQIDESYVIEPVYNEEVLSQIHNSNAIGRFVENDNHAGMVVYQEPDGTIKSVFNEADRWRAHLGGSSFSRVFNSRNDEPTPDEVMVGSRLMAIAKPGSSATSSTALQTLVCNGSEVVSSYDIYSNHIDANGQMHINTLVSNYINRGNPNNINFWAHAAQFDWFPIMYLVRQEEENDASKVSILDIISDVDNYTVVGPDTLNKLNDCALLSMFGVPNAAQG